MDLYSLFAQFDMYLNGLSVIKENSSTYILKFIISCLRCYSKVYVNILVSKLIVDIFFLWPNVRNLFAWRILSIFTKIPQLSISEVGIWSDLTTLTSNLGHVWEGRPSSSPSGTQMGWVVGPEGRTWNPPLWILGGEKAGQKRNNNKFWNTITKQSHWSKLLVG